MTLRPWIKGPQGNICCPDHALLGRPVQLQYIEQASGALVEQWQCPVDQQRYIRHDHADAPPINA